MKGAGELKIEEYRGKRSGRAGVKRDQGVQGRDILGGGAREGKRSGGAGERDQRVHQRVKERQIRRRRRARLGGARKRDQG